VEEEITVEAIVAAVITVEIVEQEIMAEVAIAAVETNGNPKM
jgi:hypothetical protein